MLHAIFEMYGKVLQAMIKTLRFVWANVALGLVIVGVIVVVWFVTAYKPRRNNNLMLCQHS